MSGVTELRVAMTVDDFETAVGFYRDALGLPQIADWSSDDVKETIAIHDIPVNPLHAKGFSSLPLAFRDFGINTFVVDPGIQANVEVFFDNCASNVAG